MVLGSSAFFELADQEMGAVTATDSVNRSEKGPCKVLALSKNKSGLAYALLCRAKKLHSPPAILIDRGCCSTERVL